MTTEQLTVAVHGVTGPQGATVARALTKAGHHVRGLARHPGAIPDGVEAVPADLLDADALTRAYAGADAVVVHLPTAFAAEVALAQADAVLHAVRQAGVRRLVVNPNLVPPPVEVGVPYLDARTRLAGGAGDGVVTSVVAPAAQYMENLNAPWSAPRVLDEGVVAYPLPAELPVPWVALDDVADAVADVLAAAQPPALTVVTGPQPLTGPQAAAAIASGLGRPAEWRTIPAAEYRDMLAPHIGTDGAAGIAGLYEAVLAGQVPPPAPLPPEVVRTGATTLETWAATQSWPYRTT
jgi:uncharacterized protein YbjT (DUF2867 family)